MKKISLLLSILLITASGYAQSKQVQLHLSAGMKFLQTSKLKHDVNVLPTAVPTIGGGLTWVKGRLLAGAEFSYSDGNEETDGLSTVLTGINFNILG
jgi:hypothetical protein